MLSEWGLWNNSWVKNLPVRPLAPRRKPPGQLYPAFRPSGQGQKFFNYFYHQDLDAIIIRLCLWNGGTHTLELLPTKWNLTLR